MIVTIFGDVHGNLIALEKMFEIEKNQTDLFVSHGDIVNYGPWTNQCVQFLNSVENCKLLKGNHEHYFIDSFYDGKNEIAQAFFKTCIHNFDTVNLEIIKNYNQELVMDNYTIQHTLFNQYIFADTDLSNFTINTNYIIGHSHQQYRRKLGNFDIFNTGSLGQNREYINQSCYLKLDTKTGQIELKNLIHDINKVIAEMKSRKYPEICLNYYKSKKQL
jgi:predicted phosphodiesterase